MQMLLDMKDHPATRLPLKRYLGLVNDPYGRNGWWEQNEIRSAWRRRRLRTTVEMDIARAPLRLHQTQEGKQMAREVFSLARVCWRKGSGAARTDRVIEGVYKHHYLLLRRLESRRGRVLEAATVIGDYSVDYQGDTGLGVAKAYRGRGLGRLLLLAVQKSLGHAGPARFVTRAGYNNRRSAHRFAVDWALRKGARVPLYVLKEYPDLARKYALRMN